MTMPLEMPKLVLVAVNELIAVADPLYCMFDTVTPGPKRMFCTRPDGGVPGVVINCDTDGKDIQLMIITI
jgi:hypothetical protein